VVLSTIADSASCPELRYYAMPYAQTFVRFAGWGLEALLLPPLLAAAALAGFSVAWAGYKQKPMRTGLWKRYHWLAAMHLVFFFAALAVGVIWQNPQTNPTLPHPASRVGTTWLGIVTYASYASCVFWVWRMRGFRWFASSLMLLLELPVFGALLIAGMSVGGEWL